MTKKIRITPFCVDMSKATEDEIRWLHAKCLEAGANNYKSLDEFLKETYIYNYKGVCEDRDTYSSDCLALFEHNLLTLDQVESHLGLTPASEADTSSVSDSPVKWTIAMQKAGKPLEVGMAALNDGGVEVTINCIGNTNYFVTNDMGMEYCLSKDCVSPFPDEETPEQVKQREEFIKLYGDLEHLSIDLHEALDSEELYEKVKHLFKY